jgi:hypothetical protein
VHRAFFRREAESWNLVFDEAEEIFLERFRVLHVIGRSDAQPE